jgi:hypothetical protein
MAFANTVKFTAGNSGTPDFSDGTAGSTFRNLSGGAVSGQTYSYRAVNGTEWENGQGVYNGTTLARTTIFESSTGSKVSFTAAPTVILTPLKFDLDADQQRQNALLNMANLSKALGSSLRVLETFADGYKGTDGINAGASSNVDTSHTAASGYVGPAIVPTTTQIGSNPTSSISLSGGYVVIDRSVALTTGWMLTKIGIYLSGAQTVTLKVAKRNSSGNYDFPVSQSLVHPGGGWADLTLSSPYTVPSGGNYYVAVYANGTVNLGATAALRAYKTPGDATGSGVAGFTEDTATLPVMRVVHDPLPQNMTLATAAQTADASVANGRVLLEIDPIDSTALNTDLTVEVTCDGGSHWATATLASLGKGQDGRTVVETADTACTAGTSFAARIKTLNNKSVNVYKAAVAVH